MRTSQVAVGQRDVGHSAILVSLLHEQMQAEATNRPIAPTDPGQNLKALVDVIHEAHATAARAACPVELGNGCIFGRHSTPPASADSGETGSK